MSDLVPNDGSFYAAPEYEEHQKKVSKERADAKAILPVLEDTVDWFDKQADAIQTVTTIKKIVKDFDVSADNAMIAVDLVGELLRTKKGEYRSLLETYRPKK